MRKIEYAAVLMYMGKINTVQYAWRHGSAEECAKDLTPKDRADGWRVGRITVEVMPDAKD